MEDLLARLTAEERRALAVGLGALVRTALHEGHEGHALGNGGGARVPADVGDVGPFRPHSLRVSVE